MTRQRIIIIGASSAIAEHCARLWAQQPADFVLVGRDRKRVERVAADLQIRSPQSSAQSVVIDFNDAAAIAALAAQTATDGKIDIVLIAHGNLPVQADCEQDLSKSQQALEINGVSPVLFAEAFAAQLQKAGRGTLAIIGSVAGDRGRKTNYVYGAAKGLIERYAQGLQHRFAGTPVKIVLIKPGPTATPMTAHLPPRGLALPEAVARVIVAAIAKGSPVVYAPARWALIMMVIRHLPRFVFNRLNI
jgi:decaprenylphospho-beta-D-erythro-pentofuranosid-2-ulose 2-reductase